MSWIGNIFNNNHQHEHESQDVKLKAVSVSVNETESDESKVNCNEKGNTVLLRYIQSMRWSEALLRLKEAPEESCIQYKSSELVAFAGYECDDNDNDNSYESVYFYPINLVCQFYRKIDEDGDVSHIKELALELIKEFPDAVKCKDHTGRLPIHIVCWKGTSLERMKEKEPDQLLASLISVYMDGLMISDYHGRVPLHVACQTGLLSEADIELLVQTCPHTKRCTDFLTRTPYDIAIENLSVIDKDLRQKILNLVDPAFNNVQALNKKLGSDQHKTCNKFSARSKSMMGIDVIGDTILYSFITEKCWDDVITRCADYKNDATTWYIEKRSSSTNVQLVKKPQVRILPIHRACEMSDVTVSAINALIQAYPKSVEAKDQSKRLPIHSACWKNVQCAVIERIAEAYDEGLNVGDCHNSLPLHVACQFGASIDVIALLLRLNPKAVDAKDGFGRTALDITKFYCNPNKVDVTKLLKSHNYQPSAPLLNSVLQNDSITHENSNTFPRSLENSV